MGSPIAGSLDGAVFSIQRPVGGVADAKDPKGAVEVRAKFVQSFAAAVSSACCVLCADRRSRTTRLPSWS